MSTADKLTTVSENVSKVHEAGIEQGKKSAYDEFWDSAQGNGTRTDYQCAFAGTLWNDKTFKPKYDIVPTNAHQMFNRSNIGDLKGILDSQGVVLDFSKITSANSLFANCQTMTHVGEVNFSKVTTSYLGEMFYFCQKLHTIDKLILPDRNYTFTNMFSQCTSLVNITIEGTIANSISLSSSPLSKESITSVINALSSTVTGKTLTLKKSAVNTAFGIDVDDGATYPEGSEFYALRHSKDNWTISYA